MPLPRAGKQIPRNCGRAVTGVPVVYSEQMLNMAQNDFIVFVPARA